MLSLGMTASTVLIVTTGGGPSQRLHLQLELDLSVNQSKAGIHRANGPGTALQILRAKKCVIVRSCLNRPLLGASCRRAYTVVSGLLLNSIPGEE